MQKLCGTSNRHAQSSAKHTVQVNSNVRNCLRTIFVIKETHESTATTTAAVAVKKSAHTLMWQRKQFAIDMKRGTINSNICSLFGVNEFCGDFSTVQPYTRSPVHRVLQESIHSS